MKLVRYSGNDDWSALYVDGVLDKVGDHYLIEDRISELVGVIEYQNDNFLRGGNSYNDVAQSLDEIDAYIADEALVKLFATPEEKLAEAEARILELEQQLKDR